MILAVLAQVAADVSPLAGQGILGAMFAWLALRVEKRIDKMTDAVNGLTTIMCMDLSSRAGLPVSARKIVREQLKRMGLRHDE